MATYTAEQVYNHLRYGDYGAFVQFHCPTRVVTIWRMTTGVDTMPTCRIVGDGPSSYDEDRPSVLEPLIERLLKEESENDD